MNQEKKPFTLYIPIHFNETEAKEKKKEAIRKEKKKNTERLDAIYKGIK